MAGVGEDSYFEAFAATYASDPRFLAVPSDSDRLIAFDDAAGAVRAQREAREQAEAEAAEAEGGFRRLLAEREQDVAAGVTWAQLRRELWAEPRCADGRGQDRAAQGEEDSTIPLPLPLLAAPPRCPPRAPDHHPPWRRYDAVPEPRRAQLYEEYASVVAGALAAPAGAAPAEPAAPAVNAEQLDFLRQEQAKLKAEYEK